MCKIQLSSGGADETAGPWKRTPPSQLLGHALCLSPAECCLLLFILLQNICKKLGEYKWLYSHCARRTALVGVAVHRCRGSAWRVLCIVCCPVPSDAVTALRLCRHAAGVPVPCEG